MKHFLLASSFYYSVKYSNQTYNMNVFDGPKKMYAISILKPDNDSGVDGLVKMFYNG